jgi:hypothetical protein
VALTEPAASARPLPQYATIATVFSSALDGFVLLARHRSLTS